MSLRDHQQQSVYPSLLDRLTCDSEGSTDQYRTGAVFVDGYHRQALRDVSYLLNARAFHPASHLDSYPLIQEAVVNMGLPNLTGKTRSQLDEDHVAQMIRSALRRFEPRLDGDSLKVTLLAPSHASRSTFLSFLIEGLWWSLPYPEHVRLRTDLDLETGQFDMFHDGALS